MRQFFLFFFLLFPTIFPLQATSFEERLSEYIVKPKEGEKPYIGRVVIDDAKNGITQSTWLYVNAAMSYYKKHKPLFIILELNTPGGEVYSSQRICDLLKEIDTQYGIPVIAYIDNWAISAGAMLAYSCRFIVIAKDASMGAAEPVYLGGENKMESAPEKVNSALRSEFFNRAQFYGRNGDIAEAMVDKDVILVKRGNSIIKLTAEDQIQKNGPVIDFVISPKGKLLTLSADKLIEFGVADFLLQPIKLGPLTDSEIGTGSWLFKKSALSQIPFLEKFDDIPVDTFSMDWQTKFLAFLSLPAVTSLLVLGMVVGIYVEIAAHGFGVAGILGLVCFFFLILSSFALEAIHWLEPLLLLFGLFLISLEFFFFPTLGLLGFLGGLFALAGFIGMLLPGLASVQFDGQSVNGAGEFVLSRLGWLSGAIIAALVIIVVLSRFMKPSFGFMKKIVLGDTKMLATGTHEMETKYPVIKVPLKVGQAALSSVTLRPAGRIEVNGIEYDAVSTGSFIEKGSKVTVSQIEGEKIIVEEIQP